MDWKIEYLEGWNLVRVTLIGDFRAEDFPIVFEELLSAEYWRLGKPILFDNRDLVLNHTDYAQINGVSHHFQNYAPRFGAAKIALLKKTLGGFGVGRQFQMITEEHVAANFKVFLDETEAVNWLVS